MTHDFRRVLQQELIRRCEGNSRYSLRAYAKSLNISHASLSHILAGRRPLTEKMIRKLVGHLNITPDEASEYLFKSSQEPQNYQQLTLDTFTVISVWYHDAICELSQLKNFKSDPKWISKVLGITVNEVNMAVDRLIRLNLLEIKKDGTWIDLSRNNSTPLAPDFSTAALRRYQKKILEFSIQALDEVPKSEREHVSNMMAIQKSDISEVKKIINKFRWQLSKFLQRQEANPDAVYQVAISFFPITKYEYIGDK